MGSSPESIFKASKLLFKIENQWDFIKNGLLVYRAKMPEIVKDTGRFH